MKNNIKRSLFYQHDKADCGIACLMTILKYYNRNKSLEELRYLSGTTKEGTTLLGLYQCANKIGFIANGCKGTIEDLEKSPNPIILRITINNVLHFVVFFRYDKKKELYVIGDPAKGILRVSKDELIKLWKDCFCLTLLPNNIEENIYKIKNYKKDRRKFVISLISKDRRILFYGLSLSLIISFLGLSLSVYSQQLIDNILPSQSINKFIWSIVVLGILLIVRIILNYIKDILFNFQSKSFNIRINTKFYNELLHLPKLFFDTRKVGDLIARINDTSKIQSIIYLFFNRHFNNIFTILVSIFIILTYSNQIGLITICFIPILIGLIVVRGRDILRKQHEVQLYYSLTESNYISTISGISDIKNLNREDFFSKFNSELFGEYQTSKFNLSMNYVKLNAIINFISIIYLITIICFSIYYISIGELSIGDLIAIMSISSIIISSTADASLLFIPFTEAKIAFERMYSIINIKKAVGKKMFNKEENIELINRITVKNIAFKYPGMVKSIFKNASIILNKGDLTILTGDCGVGKSTFIDILLGNYIPEEGEISYNENDLETIDKKKLKQKIRIVPQNIHIFNGDLLFNITLENSIDIKKIEQLNEKFDLPAFLRDFPQSLHTIVGEEGVTLSGGQKQIIGVLRALYDNPQVLILDEPTTSLDEKYISTILQLLEKIKDNIIILVISHEILKFSAITDKLYKIENAQINQISID